jgi:hypothetical protein
MRIFQTAATILFVLATLNVCYADDENAIGNRRQPTGSTAIPVALTGKEAASGSAKNSFGLTRDEIQAQILEEQRKLAKLQRLLNAQDAHADVTSNGDAQSSPNPKKKITPKPAQSATGDTARFQKLYLREIGYPNEAAAIPPKSAPPDPCNPNRFFIRANSLDNYLYGITPASKAKGASISYTDDHVAGTKTATINGMVSYVLFRDLCPTTPPGDAPFFSGYSIAPFILGQGNYAEPRAKTESSTLKYGVENEFEISRGLLPRQVFTVAPYGETDYRGIGRAYGVNGFWDVYDAGLHLGGYIDTNPDLGWFVQLRGETDLRQVDVIGVTNLTNKNYEWVGGTARLNMFFFPSNPTIPEVIRNRVSLIASASYFDDRNSGMETRLYSATLAYKITPDGSASVALEYDYGTDKDTLVMANKYLVTLTYAY